MSNFNSYNSSESSSNSFSEAVSDFSAESDSESFSEGGSSGRSSFSSAGVSSVPVWVPIPTQELGSEAEWSREEKVSRVAEMLKTQQQRHCFIKLDNVLTQPLLVPFVRTYSTSPENLLEYEKEVYREQNALAGPEVDRILDDNEQRFLSIHPEVIEVEPIRETRLIEAKQPAKTKKKTIFEDIDPIGRE